MSKVLVNETSLNGIAAAIRDKNGETTKYKPSEMAAAISALAIGGGEQLEIPVLTGNISYWDYQGRWDWVIRPNVNKITTKDLTDLSNSFNGSYLSAIPFVFNGDITKETSLSYMFQGCTYLEDIGDFNNIKIKSTNDMFNYCANLRYLPNFNNCNWDSLNSSGGMGGMLQSMHSLRSIPADLMKKLYTNGSAYSCFLTNLCTSAYALDEIVGIVPITSELTSNRFSNSFTNCFRLKNLTFAKKADGTPYIVNWSAQTISLYSGIGWLTSLDDRITGYNSGITRDKKYTNIDEYNLLKNDPDSYTNQPELSRFNHASAVNLIDSLPDTYEFVTKKGSTNTIQFRNNAGSYTDEGGCGDLTEEEIAVAASKGWTIVYKT